MKATKTLTQQIAELEDDQIIHIGAKCNFFFCGTKAEYETDIDAISNQLLAEMQEVRRNLLRDKIRFYELWGQLSGRMASILADPGAVLAPDDQKAYSRAAQLANSLTVLLKRMPSVNRRIPVLEQNIKEFKPVRERTVLDFYPRLEDGAGVNIIVEGCETGHFWTVDEYRNGVTDEEYTEVAEDD